MKTLFVTISIIVAFSLNALSQSNKVNNLGLVSQLVEIKYISETKLSIAFKDSKKNSNEDTLLLEYYNSVRIQLEKIIYQMAADMRSKNSPRLFKAMNKYYKSHDLTENSNAKPFFKKYADALLALYNTYQIIINLPAKPKTIGADALISIAGLGWTIYKDIHDMQGKTVEGIVNVLTECRLSPPAVVLQKDPKDPKEK